jgi:predicted nucleic acid-binding protein
MIAPDTSVLIAGFIPDHPFYGVAEVALTEVCEDGRLIAHTMAETYAVLSGPADVFRVEPDVVVAYLDEFLGDAEPIQPRPDAYREALELLSGEGRGGASIYDALIALTARDAGATLISLDRRAKLVYELCGVEFRFLDES